jgi:hypothetical protein
MCARILSFELVPQYIFYNTRQSADKEERVFILISSIVDSIDTATTSKLNSCTSSDQEYSKLLRSIRFVPFVSFLFIEIRKYRNLIDLVQVQLLDL